MGKHKTRKFFAALPNWMQKWPWWLKTLAFVIPGAVGLIAGGGLAVFITLHVGTFGAMMTVTWPAWAFAAFGIGITLAAAFIALATYFFIVRPIFKGIHSLVLKHRIEKILEEDTGIVAKLITDQKLAANNRHTKAIEEVRKNLDNADWKKKGGKVTIDKRDEIDRLEDIEEEANKALSGSQMKQGAVDLAAIKLKYATIFVPDNLPPPPHLEEVEEVEEEVEEVVEADLPIDQYENMLGNIQEQLLGNLVAKFELLKMMVDFSKKYKSRNVITDFDSAEFSTMYTKLCTDMKKNIADLKQRIKKLKQDSKKGAMFNEKQKLELKMCKDVLDKMVEQKTTFFTEKAKEYSGTQGFSIISDLEEEQKKALEMTDNQKDLTDKLDGFSNKFPLVKDIAVQNDPLKDNEDNEGNDVCWFDNESAMKQAYQFRNKLLSLKNKREMTSEDVIDKRISNLGREIGLYIDAFIEKSKVKYKDYEDGDDKPRSKNELKEIKAQIKLLKEYKKNCQETKKQACSDEIERLAAIVTASNTKKKAVVTTLKGIIKNDLPATLKNVKDAIKTLKRLKALKKKYGADFDAGAHNGNAKTNAVALALTGVNARLKDINKPKMLQVLADDKGSSKTILKFMMESHRLAKKTKSAIDGARLDNKDNVIAQGDGVIEYNQDDEQIDLATLGGNIQLFFRANIPVQHKHTTMGHDVETKLTDFQEKCAELANQVEEREVVGEAPVQE